MVIGSVEVVGTVVSYVVASVVITDILATVASIDFAILELVVTLEVEFELSASTQIDTSYQGCQNRAGGQGGRGATGLPNICQIS